jgi:hypothetical protein
MEENLKISITISPYDYKLLRRWGGIHGKSPSAYAGQILAARLEANFELIERQTANYAKSRGISLEEAEAELEGEE